MTPTTARRVRVPADGLALDGDLVVPADPRGLVVFVHGSGSSRSSPRNRLVAARLEEAGAATLLLDLLTPREAAIDEELRGHRFDIDLLAGRVRAAIDWADEEPGLRDLGLGLYGASTGAAAALVAAADRQDDVEAIVSRGGRPDLAGEALARVRAPTLLIVGERDREVLALNRLAAARLVTEREVVVVPGATHLFEEPGALDRVARHACAWFETHLHPRCEETVTGT